MSEPLEYVSLCYAFFYRIIKLKHTIRYYHTRNNNNKNLTLRCLRRTKQVPALGKSDASTRSELFTGTALLPSYPTLKLDSTVPKQTELKVQAGIRYSKVIKVLIKHQTTLLNDY